MVIDYRNVSIFQEDVEILKNVSLQVNDGEFAYIIGKVGSGKSSLIKTMYGELDIYTSEKAEVLGKDMATLRRKEIPALRRETGIIFQDFQLLHDKTVYQNLRFVLEATGWKDKTKIDERIENVLADVGMTEMKNKKPHELSGGEQQRIAIARAILNNPKMILADEPTGNLDPETALHIVGLLKSISERGTTVLITTHNIHLIDKFPGTVYRCDNGELKNVTHEYKKVATLEKYKSWDGNNH
ncbi:cell division ATP-binding protein FtsE [Hoylesella marshii]|uniref:ABC transporter, ATP-binding protein n=1 Tax=Hoylesella marshii DSM 16973 = JCM 13450 TaxID=862515 RepID=E0NRF3_9BACT|nr:ATP-binding cassette domain-containing protein [Hoylesella marshii]EFM02249.1 ABC transporter, ATP-binding protein [Hoylesella marshii DSM 16973 = JCM 13450]